MTAPKQESRCPGCDEPVGLRTVCYTYPDCQPTPQAEDGYQMRYGQQQARNAVFMQAMATLARDPRKRAAAQHWVKEADAAAAAVRTEDFVVANVNNRK